MRVTGCAILLRVLSLERAQTTKLGGGIMIGKRINTETEEAAWHSVKLVEEELELTRKELANG